MSPNDTVIEEFRANHGQVGGMFGGMQLLLLTTVGAKTGQPRIKPVVYTKDGDHYVVIASMGGAPVNPAWYHNLKAHPEVTVEVAGEKFAARATEATGDERDRLYQQHAAKYPQFNDYQAKTDRQIPVFVLERV